MKMSEKKNRILCTVLLTLFLTGAVWGALKGERTAPPDPLKKEASELLAEPMDGGGSAMEQELQEIDKTGEESPEEEKDPRENASENTPEEENKKEEERPERPPDTSEEEQTEETDPHEDDRKDI